MILYTNEILDNQNDQNQLTKISKLIRLLFILTKDSKDFGFLKKIQTMVGLLEKNANLF